MMKSENMNPKIAECMIEQITLEDLIYSPLADREGIDNTPPEAARCMLKILLNRVLSPIERLIGQPLRVVSGYRSAALNRLVKGRLTYRWVRVPVTDSCTTSSDASPKKACCATRPWRLMPATVGYTYPMCRRCSDRRTCFVGFFDAN